MSTRRALLAVCGIGLAVGLIASAPARAPDRLTLKPELEAFVAKMAQDHGFDDRLLRTTFSQLKPNENIIKAFERPSTAKPWHEFRSIFLTKTRIEGGVKFWQEHAALLARARQVYGVPEQVVTAIVGIESIYGQRTGAFRIIDSLYTLGFEVERRAQFFRSELEQFLLLSRENGFDPLEVKGSFAGAMGIPQFISSSYRTYAVDFDGDGRVDLWNSVADVIGSVAHYLSIHGWEADQPVTVSAQLSGDAAFAVLERGMKPNLTVAEMKGRGVEPGEELPDAIEAGLFSLDGKDAQEHWMAFKNFYVITRYNRSKNYAMAVHQLSQEIAQAYAQAPTPQQAAQAVQ